MRYLSLLLLSFFSYCVCLAQKPLTNSRVSSFYTYIYKLNDADLIRFYNDDKKKPDAAVLQHPIDSVLTDKYKDPQLPPGNYLKVYASENKLNYSLIENHTATFQLLDNQKDLRFALLDKKGNEVKDAEAFVNNRRISYDTGAQLYRTRYSKKNKLIKISYQGVLNYFNIEQKEKSYNGYYRQSLWRKIVFRAPVKYVWFPLHDLFSTHPYYKQTAQLYFGYMVFNKPMYKPNDTVRFKAYIFRTGSRKPVKQTSLFLKLKERYGDDGKIIGKVNSYRDGAFEGTVVLNDSLKLTLDETYTLNLENSDKPKAKNNVLLSGTFKYEEYELKSVKFALRADKEEGSPGSPTSLYLKATDENDLSVADGRVELTLTTDVVHTYNNNTVFVPDTLWKHKLQLDPVGETKVVIPDSIFPKAKIKYSVKAVFLNSNNEQQVQNKNLSFTNDRHHISTKLNQDTLKINYQVNGIDATATGTITGLDARYDTLSAIKITLPGQIVINPNVKEYDIKTDSIREYPEMKDFTPNIVSNAIRTADSLFISVDNPRHIPFWYTIFSGNKIIETGKATDLFYKKAYRASKNVFLLLNYIWAGEPKSDEVTVVYQDKLLTIKSRQPLSVYPGQTVPMEINVTNSAGKPVADADLTAFALTSKFKDFRAPFVPYFGKLYPSRKLSRKLELGDAAERGVFELNWKRWGREMGLDSIAYFQFTHPKNLYQIAEFAPDSLTQIAPFVVKDGDILPIHVLFIDERPVYFSQAEQMQRYSFAVTPGRHKLSFRTLNRTIIVDQVFAAKGCKTILSINADTANREVKIIKMPDTLTRYEANLLNKYMIKVVDNFGYKMATVSQQKNIVLLNPSPGGYSRYDRGILTGPLTFDYASLNVKNGDSLNFLAEPGYSYEFMPGLLKQKSLPGLYAFDTHLLSKGNLIPSYKQYALSAKGVDTLWRQYLDNRSYSSSLFNNEYINSRGNGKLIVNVDGYGLNTNDPYKKNPLIKSITIYRYNNPDYLRIYSGNTTGFGYLQPGKYRMLFLLTGDKYFILDSVMIKANGINYYKTDFKNLKNRDNVSIKISAMIDQRSEQYGYGNNEEQPRLGIKEAFNAEYLDNSTFSDQMTGQVIDKAKEPIPGVSIVIKGTGMAAVTDMNGRFKIKVPPFGKLRINSIGFETQEVDIKPGADVKIVLAESAKMLNEVVVVGYGTERRSEMTGSVSTIYGSLQGRLAGVNITLRGNRSTLGNDKPLYVVDGVIVENGVPNVDAADIADLSVLKDDAATAIYGARAAAGVIIITTKKGKKLNANEATVPGQSAGLRSHFSDYAYWQPKLKTDDQGNAKFNVTFPDDITSWRTVVIGVAGKFTGYAEGQIKAYKALSANMVTPQFAIEGDQMNLIGKVMNYTTAPVTVNRIFNYDNQNVKQGRLTVKNAVIDTFRITAAGKDSLKFEYTVKKDNGYFDGERRSIPLFEQGVLETKGVFADLEKDTVATFKFDPALGKVTLRAEASILPALTEEADRLRNYEYLCNEQLASKLKGLMTEKRICTYLGKPFTWDDNVRKLVKKLQENRRTEGTWGWWKDNNEELWISLHAIEALTDAQKEGYQVRIDKQKLIDYLIYQATSYTGINKLDAISLLLKLNAKANYADLIGTYEKALPAKVKTTEYDKLRLMSVKQQAGLPVSIDSLIAKRRGTMFGNVYWGENNSYQFFDNSIQVSILAYHIIKADGKHPDILPRIRNYFLEQRKDGYWRNTYESSLILETILPDVLTGGQLPAPSKITLSGDKNETVTQFPYTTTMNPGNGLTISKTGAFPVYVTGYQTFWNKQPARVSKDFTVNTWFENSGSKVSKLKGGEAVTLTAEVTARADADFVMVEIPIPAGCSYESKEQNYWGNEVHREYFKNKVSIFCRKLTQGKYTFTIKLMPRYGGLYTLNPAKAEMMYFPVFYGREDLKKVVIE